jgi:signal transduction histidine kinase
MSDEDLYSKYFNPDDISPYANTLPPQFIKAMAHEILVPLSSIRLITSLILQLQNSELMSISNKPLFDDVSLNEMMIDITSYTDKINQMLLTSIAYANAYEQGNISTLSDLKD